MAETCALLGVVSLVLALLFIPVGGGSSYSKTEAIVKLLDDACKAYRVQHGAFPPAAPDGNSEALVRLLGAPRPGRDRVYPPFIEFKADLIEGGAAVGPVLDEWGRRIRYLHPGKRNPDGVDIWSSGCNGRDELDPEHPDFDDITNWIRIGEE